MPDDQQTFTDIQPIEQTFTDVQPIKKYFPGRKFGMEVAKGMGLDAGKIVAAEDAGGTWAGAKEVGSQALSGLGKFAVSVAKDPFKIAEPFHGMASSLEQGIKERSPGQVLGATGAILGGAESTEGTRIPARAAETAKAAAKAAAKAVPEAATSAWRKAGNPFGLASTGEELLTQGISPRTSLTGFKNLLTRAAGDLKAYDAETPIKSVQDLNEAIPEMKQKIWSKEVEPALQRQGSKPVKMQPVAEAVRQQISSEMKEFDPANAEKLETLATKLENARDVKSANSLLKYANGQLESYFQKFPAARRANLMNNPETAGWEAARSSLREQFLQTLEDSGEIGVRNARLRYGALSEIGDAVERRVNVADRAKPISLSRMLGWASGLVSGPIGPIAGEVSHYLNKPDVLVKRGIKKIRTTPWGEGGATLSDLQ